MTDISSLSNPGLLDTQRYRGQIHRSEVSLTAAQTPDQLQKAAQAFEGLVLGQLLAPMMNTLPTDGPFGGGSAEGMFRSFMVDEIGKTVARSGGVGIADMVYDQLVGLQEG